jgi:hypothetical protein
VLHVRSGWDVDILTVTFITEKPAMSPRTSSDPRRLSLLLIIILVLVFMPVGIIFSLLFTSLSKESNTRLPLEFYTTVDSEYYQETLQNLYLLLKLDPGSIDLSLLAATKFGPFQMRFTSLS